MSSLCLKLAASSHGPHKFAVLQSYSRQTVGLVGLHYSQPCSVPCDGLLSSLYLCASEDKVNIISFGVPDGRSEVLCLSNLENCLIWKVACVLPLCRESPSSSLS